jgi:beta-glucanase (GH16 family)
MYRFGLGALLLAATTLCPKVALATRSAELYTSSSYGYGRVSARMRVPAGDGVIGSFFLWKEGSEQAGTFWNEVDFEKVGADCHLQTNPLYGNPVADLPNP